ncbi:hypothetical protein ACH5RR_034172 [Cinchona calisaya]|uniref:Uncharacterized protein n=1 Tax=Cinchona calisaya TaxID=153742 RepID=A0ABD2YBF0_9GENT
MVSNLLIRILCNLILKTLVPGGIDGKGDLLLSGSKGFQQDLRSWVEMGIDGHVADPALDLTIQYCELVIEKTLLAIHKEAMVNQKNRDPYVVLNLITEAFRKEKEATERVNEKLLDHIVKEKQRLQWSWNDWDKECVILRKKIKEQEEEIKELKRSCSGTNPEENLENDLEENFGDNLEVDHVTNIEDDPKEDSNEEW